MSRRKRFDVHDLYPEDYCFDEEAFLADPENYQFTADDIAYYNAMELEDYEETVPMTPYERRLLRKWVAAGNSVHESPGSRYFCLKIFPCKDFLEIYRMDREIRAAVKGMSKAEKEAYLKDYIGWRDPVPGEDAGEDWPPIDDEDIEHPFT